MDLPLPLLNQCKLLSEVSPNAAALEHFLRETALSAAELLVLRQEDPSHPYGRRVLFQSPQVEMMLATWTRNFPCSPHEHGGSVGAVRVLRGRGRHRLWQLEAGQLSLLGEETVREGDLLSFGPELVHSMEDGGGKEPLMTLHIYSNAIEHMFVYDLDDQRTLIVDGSCGAWIPRDRPELIREVLPGFHPARALHRQPEETALRPAI